MKHSKIFLSPIFFTFSHIFQSAKQNPRKFGKHGWKEHQKTREERLNQSRKRAPGGDIDAEKLMRKTAEELGRPARPWTRSRPLMFYSLQSRDWREWPILTVQFFLPNLSLPLSFYSAFLFDQFLFSEIERGPDFWAEEIENSFAE